jgi:penicillin-binding protein 1A
MPAGVMQVNGDYYYIETPPGVGVTSLGLIDQPLVEEGQPRDEVKNELF